MCRPSGECETDAVSLSPPPSSKTPAGAVFAGSMQLLAGIKLCTGRSLTNHPHYEDQALRQRTLEVGNAPPFQAGLRPRSLHMHWSLKIYLYLLYIYSIHYIYPTPLCCYFIIYRLHTVHCTMYINRCVQLPCFYTVLCYTLSRVTILPL